MALAERKRMNGYHRAPEPNRMHEGRVLMVLALSAMIEAVQPHAAGRPAKPKELVRLEAANTELRKERWCAT
jgi:hypothetical protein